MISRSAARVMATYSSRRYSSRPRPARSCRAIDGGSIIGLASRPDHWAVRGAQAVEAVSGLPGGVIVSARITIAFQAFGAVDGHHPNLVRAISMSRFTSARASRSQARKPCSDVVSRRS